MRAKGAFSEWEDEQTSTQAHLHQRRHAPLSFQASSSSLSWVGAPHPSGGRRHLGESFPCQTSGQSSKKGWAGVGGARGLHSVRLECGLILSGHLHHLHLFCAPCLRHASLARVVIASTCSKRSNKHADQTVCVRMGNGGCTCPRDLVEDPRHPVHWKDAWSSTCPRHTVAPRRLGPALGTIAQLVKMCRPHQPSPFH
jgi:hypothetical protein